MKFNNILKFLVIVLVLSSAISKRVKRSKTTSKSLYKVALAAQADVKGMCYEWNREPSKRMTQWVVLDTESVKNGKSGIIMRNYYTKENFNCSGLVSISKRKSTNTFFLPYRNFSNSYEAAYANNGILYMRRLTVYTRYGAISMHVEKGMFSSHISESEVKTLSAALNSNKDDYLKDVKNRRLMMDSTKVRAENLAWNKQQNINTQAQLDKALADKKTELNATKEAHKKLTAASEASKLLIREYKKQQQTLVNNDLKALNEDLQTNLTRLDALEQQQKENEDKIKGIKPIDHNDLAQSKTTLSTLLTSYANTFLESDPNSAILKDLIANLSTQMGTIASKIQ